MARKTRLTGGITGWAAVGFMVRSCGWAPLSVAYAPPFVTALLMTALLMTVEPSILKVGSWPIGL